MSHDVTHLLQQIDTGNVQAAEQLLPLVYNELRQLAARRLSHESPGQTLQATALVHEAFLRLVGSSTPLQFQGREHFFAIAAEAMRRILVDRARAKLAIKRGGQIIHEELVESELGAVDRPAEIIAVHDALNALAREDSLAAEVVKLRYFGGFSFEEMGKILGISHSKAHRTWEFARTWLKAELSENSTNV